jgi:SAM-dependent methyltransferase
MNCPICEHQEFWQIPAVHDAQVAHLCALEGDDADHNWRLCSVCGNAYPSNPPNLRVLQKLWSLNRIDSGSTPDEKLDIWAYRRAIAKAGAARSYRFFAPLALKAKSSFLDIACGLGETVRMFASHDWDAEGIDADPSTARFHHELGIRARIGQFEEIAVGTSYDIVHVAHAIYFITNPMGFLRIVRERLAPGGLFCVVLADFMANSDPALPSYAHTFFPTASSMRYALALAGFETVFSKRLSGSIFVAARPAEAVAMPSVWSTGTWLLYRTKALRYTLLGRPYLLLRRAAKLLIGHHRLVADR